MQSVSRIVPIYVVTVRCPAKGHRNLGVRETWAWKGWLKEGFLQMRPLSQKLMFEEVEQAERRDSWSHGNKERWK